MPVELNRESKEYVFWQVTSPAPEAIATVELALLVDPNGRPLEVDWVAATLVGPADPTGDGVNYWIRALISGTGQGGDIALAAGDYQAWARATSVNERPVRQVGVVTIL